MSTYKTLLCALLMIISFSVFSQTYFYTNNGDYKYFVGKKEPDKNWRNTDFDDSGWKTGYKIIGYGHSNDSTTIEPTPSVYLRIKFDVSNKDSISQANFFVDFDDAFIAYLNGVEITRMYIGKPGEFIPYNRLADRAHEAFVYRKASKQIFGFYLDKEILSKSLVNGKNILSVQVHNDSVNGSDLTFNSRLINLDYKFFNMYDNESFGKRQITLESTKLPIIKINTDQFGIPQGHVKYKAQMKVINNGPGKLNKPGDKPTDFDGKISIEIRGESSKDFAKRPYNIETQDESGKNMDVSLLGMPPENDWILLGPFADKTQIRSEIVLTIARRLGQYQPRTRYCEVIMNDEFVGLYVLTEKIKRDTSRVDVAKLNPEDNTGLDVTGGYIVKYDKPGSGTLQWVYPEEDAITQPQKDYITNFYKEYYAILDKPELTDSKTGYKKYIDDKSLINYMIINEFSKNCDGYLFSTYMYKVKDKADKPGKLNFGPMWDNDLAFGNAPDAWQQGFRSNGWQFAVNKDLKITKILGDTAFERKFVEKWLKLRKSYLHTDSIMHLIDSLTNYIYDARVRNYRIWPIINKDIFFAPYHSDSYDEDIQIMKNWILKRLDWIDNNISQIDYPLPKQTTGIFDQSANNENCQVYPNPFSDKLSINLKIIEPGYYNVELRDILGKEISLARQIRFDKGLNVFNFENKNNAGLTPGTYIILISKSGNVIYRQKIMKY